MSVTTKCGGCNMAWVHSFHDCPSGKPMHAWCGVTTDPNNPERRGAKWLCNDCSRLLKAHIHHHDGYVQDQESQDLMEGFNRFRYCEGFKGSSQGNTEESEVWPSILPPNRGTIWVVIMIMRRFVLYWIMTTQRSTTPTFLRIHLLRPPVRSKNMAHNSIMHLLDPVVISPTDPKVIFRESQHKTRGAKRGEL